MDIILSDRLIHYAAEKYQKTLPLLGEKAAEVCSVIEALSKEERVLMEFLYGTMPLSDAADCEPELLLGCVKHALFLRREKPWTAKQPENIFLNYVLCHRVNNEAIRDCRKWFYEMLEPLLESSGADSLEEVIKEINYWCAGQVSYAASDERTLDPVGVFHSGSGRCGEESTFLVTVLRSVGIAARQVYTPRWAHCDDNHAWVEVWTEDGWRFLGACEPEEVLDKGWFTNASSRAMLIHTRVFSDFSGQGMQNWKKSAEAEKNTDTDELKNDKETEEITARDGAAYYLNETSAYARTERMTVAVKDSAGEPVEGARVSFELLNGAEYYSIAELYTGGDGKVSLYLGVGSIRLHISRGNCWREVQVINHRDALVEVILSEEECRQELEEQKRNWQYSDHVAPTDFPMHPVRLTEEQKEKGRKRRLEAERLRREKLETFDRQAAELAEELSGERQEFSHRQADGQMGRPWNREQIQAILKFSFGNTREIVRFLKKYPEKQAPEFLSVLTKKDYRDIRAELLEEHYLTGQQVREYSLENYLKGEEREHQKELFLNCVWNPRIHFETITPYRSFLANALTAEQKEAFRREPEEIWEWIQSTVSCEESSSEQKSFLRNRNYSPVTTSPEGVLRTGQGSPMERKILFVAICRTLGIPARLHPATQEAEYYRDGRFHRAERSPQKENQVRLVLTVTDREMPEYRVSWTIGRLAEESSNAQGTFGKFETLDFSGKEFREGTLTLILPEGIYRLLTSVRLPDGNQLEARRLVDTKDFPAGADGIPERALELELRRPRIDQMLENLALESFSLHREDGTEVEDKHILGTGHTLLAFLEEGAEPTEHLLNELREQEREVRESGLKIVFVVTRREATAGPTLADVGKCLKAEIYYDDFLELPELLARRMYVDPEKLPLVLLVSRDRMGRYASSGYNVGSVGLLLRVAGMVDAARVTGIFT